MVEQEFEQFYRVEMVTFTALVAILFTFYTTLTLTTMTLITLCALPSAYYGLAKFPIMRAICLLVLVAFYTAFCRTLWGIYIHKTHRLSHPMTITCRGTVDSIQQTRHGTQFVLNTISTPDLKQNELPKRLVLNTQTPLVFSSGTEVDVKAYVEPFSPPHLYGDYDGRINAYFQNLGGKGSLIALRVVRKPEHKMNITHWTSEIRDRFHQNVSHTLHRLLSKNTAAIAEALLTGERTAVDEDSASALRAAGIYHILSISGMHMVLVCSVIFFAVRRFLSYFIGLAESLPLKQISAIVSFLTISFYVFVSGYSISACRAYIMCSLVLLGIVCNRRAFPTRSLALAALVEVMLTPESVLSPSFQMSYAAVAGLIGISPFLKRSARPHHSLPVVIKGILSIRNVAFKASLIALTAECCTLPYTLYYFHVFQPYGVLGNVLTSTLIDGLIMPVGVLAVLCMPTGVDTLLWKVMGLGLHIMLSLASWIAKLPFASIAVSPFEGSSVLWFSLGILILALMRSPLRMLGICALIVGFVSILRTPPTLAYLVDHGRGLVYYSRLHGTWQRAGRVNDNTFIRLLRHLGYAIPSSLPSSKKLRVVIASGTHMVLYKAGALHFKNDCTIPSTALIVTPLKAHKACSLLHPRTLIDKETLYVTHAQSIRLTSHGFQLNAVSLPQRLRFLETTDSNGLTLQDILGF